MISRTEEAVAAVLARAPEAVAAMGEAAVALVRDQMLAFEPPVKRTGALMADVRFAPNGARGEVGNTLAYAPLVHDGTTRLPARPYLAQALFSGVPRLKSAAEAVWRDGLGPD